MRLPDPLLEGRSPRPYPQLPLLAQIPARAAEGVALFGRLGPKFPAGSAGNEMPVGLTGGDGEGCLCCRHSRGAHHNGNKRGDTPIEQLSLSFTN